MKRKSILTLCSAFVLSFALLLSGCSSSETTKDKTMSVVATTYPIYDVAKAVGGTHVKASLLIPPGTEPHDWEPTVDNLKAIGNSKLFLYNGAGLEPVDKITSKDVVKNSKVVNMSTTPDLTLLTIEKEEHKEPHHDDGHKHEHKAGEIDPHYWLDPTNMAKEATYLAKLFSEADPANKEEYEKNAKNYIEKLTALDRDFTEWRASKKELDTLVVTHEAFSYLSHRYQLKQLGMMGIEPDAEPTPEHMANIIEFVKKNNIKAIFSEELISKKVAETIAKETGATVYVLNPVEGLTKEQMEKGENYITLMKANLETLKKAFNKK